MWLLLALQLAYGPYNASVLEVLDADTLRLNVAVWPGEDRQIDVHVLGVDTPSLAGACALETLMAKEAREMTRAIVGKQVRLMDVKQIGQGKKIYAQVRNIRGERLDEKLIQTGYGEKFEKNKFVSWCPKSAEKQVKTETKNDS